MKINKPYIVPREDWSKRVSEIKGNMNELVSVDALVVHHTEGNHGATGDAAINALRSIEYNHLYEKPNGKYPDGTPKPKGWSDIGYHYLIDADGVIYEGRTDEKGGAHVDDTYWNSRSLAISCIGNFMTTRLSSLQKQSLVNLLTYLAHKYGISAADICGHRDKNASDCPGDKLYAQLNEIRTEVHNKIGLQNY